MIYELLHIGTIAAISTNDHSGAAECQCSGQQCCHMFPARKLSLPSFHLRIVFLDKLFRKPFLNILCFIRVLPPNE